MARIYDNLDVRFSDGLQSIISNVILIIVLQLTRVALLSKEILNVSKT
jgi:hypothetical protein